MKRVFSILLCLIWLCSYAFATVDTPRIGGGNAVTVTLPMGESYTAEVVLAHNSVNQEDTAKSLLSNAEKYGKPIAAINGGLFNSAYNRASLEGYGAVAHCYATIVQDGMLINRGKEDAAVFLGFTEDGKALIDEVGVRLYAQFDGKELLTQGVNSYIPEPDSVLLFTPEAGYDLPVPANAKAARIVNGKVSRYLTSGTMTCEENTYYLVCGKNLYDRLPNLGDSVSFRTEFSKKEWASVKTALSGYPWLLRNGKDALDENVRLGYFTDARTIADAVALRSFAAILENGELMLGTCTASPRQLIQYLQSCHAKDALLLDGGASSMLYAEEKMLRSAGRSLNHILCLYDRQEASASSVEAVPTNQKLLVNNVERHAEIYNIGGANYFKLRDLALLLRGTGSQFSVDYEAETNSIVIQTGEPYHANGKELQIGRQQTTVAAPSSQRIEIDGDEANLAAFNISGANYFKLRDLGNTLRFNVDYDDATATMLVQSR